jgi:hypothetical protein
MLLPGLLALPPATSSKIIPHLSRSPQIGPPVTARRSLHGLAGGVPEDDAERMADGVGEDPEACLAFRLGTGGAQSK